MSVHEEGEANQIDDHNVPGGEVGRAGEMRCLRRVPLIEWCDASVIISKMKHEIRQVAMQG